MEAKQTYMQHNHHLTRTHILGSRFQERMELDEQTELLRPRKNSIYKENVVNIHLMILICYQEKNNEHNVFIAWMVPQQISINKGKSLRTNEQYQFSYSKTQDASSGVVIRPFSLVTGGNSLKLRNSWFQGVVHTPLPHIPLCHQEIKAKSS